MQNTWKVKKDQVQQALDVAHQAKNLAHAVGSMPGLEKWGEKWEHEANGLLASFEYFLTGEVLPSYRFAGWIHMPRSLCVDIRKTMLLTFDVDVDTLEVHGKETIQQQINGVAAVEAKQQALF